MDILVHASAAVLPCSRHCHYSALDPVVWVLKLCLLSHIYVNLYMLMSESVLLPWFRLYIYIYMWILSEGWFRSYIWLFIDTCCKLSSDHTSSRIQEWVLPMFQISMHLYTEACYHLFLDCLYCHTYHGLLPLFQISMHLYIQRLAVICFWIVYIAIHIMICCHCFNLLYA